jgi:hypothetical protein
MTNENHDPKPQQRDPSAAREEAAERPAYEPPQILKKRSVARVTLFSGGGPPVGGLPAGG